jgi:N-methylhydantoinase A
VAAAVAAGGVEAVAVCLLHAYANPAHEQRLGEILAEHLREGCIALSHAVSPEIREYERSSTTVLNALLMPVVRGYLERLRTRMDEAGFAPVLYLVQSNGGVATPLAAAEQPARLLLSGPSGGARATRVLGERLGEPDLVAMDMGGTSFDVSLLCDGETRLVTEGDVDGCPVRLPMVEIRTIGAGGGSLARADGTGRLRVGPESAGAVPGPAAYGRGGALPTVTDANVVLGRIDPGFFLGGELARSAAAARSAVREHLTEPLGLVEAEAAEGVVRVAVASMASAIRLSLFEKGLDPKDFALVAFGGAGGLHAAVVARDLGARRVVFPRDAGTLSAFGMLHCDVVHDLARSRLMPADASSVEALQTLAASLHEEATERLTRDGVAHARRDLALAADLRYAGQAYEITVPLAGPVPDAAALARAVTEFHERHEAGYAHADFAATPELVTLRLTATGQVPRPTEPESGPTGETRTKGHEIPPSAGLPGPAVIEEDYATIVLPRGWRLQCMPRGDLLASRAED